MSTSLADVLPGKVDTSPAVLAGFTQDETGLRGRPPRAVVRVAGVEDVVACVRWARATGTPIIPLGAGTSLEGHLLSAGDEVMLDMSGMAAIKNVSPFDFTAVVEPGVTRGTLEAALAPHGLHFPVDPGADASLGGMAATNASGTTTVHYGGMRRNVIALEMVGAGGEVLRLGRPVAKTSSGYDLKDLIIGSAGTLGIITELTLRLHPIPDTQCAVRVSFPDIGAAVAAAVAMIGAAVPVIRLEFVDAASMIALNRYRESEYPERPALFIDLAGASPAQLDDTVEMVEKLAVEAGAAAVVTERTATGRRALWRDRHLLFFAIKAAHPGHRFLTTDVAVPFSEIAGTVAAARTIASRLGIDLTTAGHIGDGNVHGVVPYVAETYGNAQQFADALVDHALAVGGTATGEHGIGLSKKRFLPAEHGAAHDVMRTIKSALDPDNLFNPGKVVDPWTEPLRPADLVAAPHRL